MKRNLFSWLLLVVLSFCFMASVSHADVLAIRSILGLSDDMFSPQTPVAQFAIDRPYDTPRPIATDEIVGNSREEPRPPLSPATDQVVKVFPSARNLTLILVVSAGEILSGNDMETGIAPMKLLQAINGCSADVGTTTIVLEARFPADYPAQIPRYHTAVGDLQMISPEPASARAPVSLGDHTVPLELARARGPVK